MVPYFLPQRGNFSWVDVQVIAAMVALGLTAGRVSRLLVFVLLMWSATAIAAARDATSPATDGWTSQSRRPGSFDTVRSSAPRPTSNPSSAVARPAGTGQQRSWSTSRKQPHSRATRTARRMLALAREDLQAGRPEVAQRLLEVLIARFPADPSTDAARRELYALYSRNEQFKVAPRGASDDRRPASLGSAGRSVAPARSADRSISARPPRYRGTAWRTEIAVPSPRQAVFRSAIGDRVFFAAGSAAIGSKARRLLQAQAAWLRRNPKLAIVVEGHADDSRVGVDDKWLAGRRAAAVRDGLVREGVDADRILVSNLSATHNIATCTDSGCAAQNRRVVVKLMDTMPRRRQTSRRTLATPLQRSAYRR